MKKMILVPESQFRHMQECTLKNNDKSVLNAINNPVQQEMVKKFNFAKQILNDPNKPSDEKMSQYSDVMSDFAILRNKVKKSAPNITKVLPDGVISDVVDSILPSLQSTAKRLLQRMEGNKGVVSWSPDGVVSINGEELSGTHIADLIGDVVRSSRSVVPERERFLRALARLNTPESLIKNKTALKQYRKIKNGSYVAHPPGLLTSQIDPLSVALPSSTDDEDDEISEPRKRTKTQSYAIDWHHA